MDNRIRLLLLVYVAVTLIGVSLAVTSRLGGLVFIAGILAAVGGLLAVVVLLLGRR